MGLHLENQSSSSIFQANWGYLLSISLKKTTYFFMMMVIWKVLSFFQKLHNKMAKSIQTNVWMNSKMHSELVNRIGIHGDNGCAIAKLYTQLYRVVKRFCNWTVSFDYIRYIPYKLAASLWLWISSSSIR